MIEQMRGDMRGRLTAAATELFYNEGLRAVSVDRIVERADTTKVTFYRHFPGKDDLVVAYLEGCAEQERAGIDDAIDRAGSDPDQAFRNIAQLIGGMACAPGFRGCPFINAAAEYPDPADKVRATVDAQRSWCRSAFERLIDPLGLADPRGTADVLMLLRDGAMVAGYLDDEDAVAASFLAGCRAVAGAASGVLVRG